MSHSLDDEHAYYCCIYFGLRFVDRVVRFTRLTVLSCEVLRSLQGAALQTYFYSFSRLARGPPKAAVRTG
ncbi:MAG: hypothetical protein KAT00_07220, partial [Planctomycetes bacterium]|nr:hypothetical protein [Planctomycetota bacterium]